MGCNGECNCLGNCKEKNEAKDLMLSEEYEKKRKCLKYWASQLMKSLKLLITTLS